MAPTGVSPAELNDYQVCSLHARVLWGIIGSTFDRGFRSDLLPGFGGVWARVGQKSTDRLKLSEADVSVAHGLIRPICHLIKI